MDLEAIKNLAESDASKPLCVVLCLVVVALWKRIATLSTRTSLLNELVTRIQESRIEDQKEHSRQQRLLIESLLRSSQAAQPLSLDDVLELDEKDFVLRSSPKR